ncbi:hypothetical protein SDC9_137468 [bioreactor metagenome]|uniref:Peptidase M28 domain-containing protein n=1 Tax=bioreactor metagenome TaxID=1076179 RepID=A0A645DM36_9ZZZZ
MERRTQEFRFLTFAPDGMEASLTLTVDGKPQQCALGIDFTPTRISQAAYITAPVTFDRNDADIAGKILATDRLFNLQEMEKRPMGILWLEDPLIKRVGVRESPLPVFSVTKKIFDQLASGAVSQASMTISAPVEARMLQNVIGVIPGRDRDKALVISAHFDGCGFDSLGIYRGAVDNASGVVTLLKCAQILKEYYAGSMPDRDIVFAAFDGEESGLIGSQYFMQGTKYGELSNINIDCVGKGNLYVQSDARDAPFAQAVSDCIGGSQTGELSGISDNMVFYFHNCPAVLVTTLLKNERGNIHTINDTAEDIDRLALLKLANGISEYVRRQCGKKQEEEKAA